MLNIWEKNIRNKKLTIKFFLEGFQFVLKCSERRQQNASIYLPWTIVLVSLLT